MHRTKQEEPQGLSEALAISLSTLTRKAVANGSMSNESSDHSKKPVLTIYFLKL